VRLGLSYDDVLLVPRRSSSRSRKDVSTRSVFTRRIEIALPVVSANMDTITESAMAIAVAGAGGIGVLHRFLPVERQAAEVSRVKRFLSVVVKDPYRIRPDDTISEARAAAARNGVTGLLVADGERLAGIVTARDVRGEPDDRPVGEVMTPRERLVTAQPGITLEEADELMHRHRIEKLPLVDGDRLAGLITLRDVELRDRLPYATRDEHGNLRVAAAVGVRGDWLDRAAALLAAGADALVLDIAHGHADHALEALRELKSSWPDTEVVAGNVATGEGVRDLARAGADAVKVGIGSGFVCTTRLVAGAGVPQLTCVLECAAAAAELGVPIVADGGIRRPADVAKAIAAGAASVMVGSLLAGTREAPGEVVIRGGRRYKMNRGMASRAAFASRPDPEIDEDAIDQYTPEGVERVVPLKESVVEILGELAGGLRSGMTYAGATTIAELQANAEFVRMTDAGRHESAPGDAEE